jgi:DNA-binding PadR family transcriptional regulator
MGFGHGPGHGFRGGRQRGEMKYEILSVLANGPSHGYDIMLAIESTSGMRPSPGSIYPALQMLEDGDFIKGTDRDGKRIYDITDKGRQLLAEREETKSPGDDDMQGFYGVIAEGMRQVHGIKDAVKQVARSGNVELYKKALPILDRARKELYALLSEHF